MSKTETPSIRFCGFGDAWEQRKFSDVVATRRGLTYKPSDIRKNGVRVLRSSNIAEDSFALSDEDVFVVREAVNIDCARANDILITAANGSSRLVGKHTIISGIPEESAVHGGFMILGTTKEPHFVNASMGSSWYRRFIELFVAGGNGAIGNLNKNDLDNQEIAIPSEEEQKKIGSFFRQLDDLITLHQRKFEKLTNVKKSMLEKMFPQNGSSYPEIRFKGFTDPWEQRKLGEVATFINGRAYSQPELLSAGKYKVLRVGNFYTNDSWYYSDLELGEKYYADYGDLLYTWSATFGPHIWLGDRVIYHYHIWKINLSDQLEKQFAVQLLEQDRANILSSKNGSTMVHITKEGMEQKDVIIPPSTKEQQEIGAFFLQLDNLITLHQRELEKLQSIKKALLEKMFV